MKPRRCSACSRLRRGAQGVAKVVLGVDRSTPELVERRLAVCRACEHLRGVKCGLCRCYVEFKARLRSEECPDGKWRDCG